MTNKPFDLSSSEIRLLKWARTVVQLHQENFTFSSKTMVKELEYMCLIVRLADMVGIDKEGNKIQENT